MPWFVFGFIAMVCGRQRHRAGGGKRCRSPPPPTFTLAVALGAMGLKTDIAKLRLEGIKRCCSAPRRESFHLVAELS